LVITAKFFTAGDHAGHERNEEFHRRIKTQTALPTPETAPMLLWAQLSPGQIQVRKVDGWEAPSHPIEPVTLDLAI